MKDCGGESNGENSGRILWIDQNDPTDTGVPIDSDYCQAHEIERTVSVGYEPIAVPDGGVSMLPGDGSGSKFDALRDENGQRHTVSGERTFIGGSTFNADPSMNEDVEVTIGWEKEHFDRLFLYHSGKDKHKHGTNVNPRHKEDRRSQFNHQRAEILCDLADLTPRQKHAVLKVVDRTDFGGRFNHLWRALTDDRIQESREDDGPKFPIVEIVTVGIMACVLAYWVHNPLEHHAVEAATEAVGVADVGYVAEEVADKIDFPWLED